MASGLALYQRAALFYSQGNPIDAFEHYHKAVKKILKDENVTAKIPAIVLPPRVPDDMPQELLGAAWRDFVGFFRDPALNITEESHPEAYKLLSSFRPSAPKSHARLERTPRGKILLKGMQIEAGLTLGLLAWDKGDRPTAAKRYREALDLAETHRPFTSPPPGTVGLEKWIYLDLQQTKDNLALLVKIDSMSAEILGTVPGRRDVADMPLPWRREDKTGAVTIERSVVFATNALRQRVSKGALAGSQTNVFWQTG